MNFERPKFNSCQQNHLKTLKAFKKKCGYSFKGSLVNISEDTLRAVGFSYAKKFGVEETNCSQGNLRKERVQDWLKLGLN